MGWWKLIDPNNPDLQASLAEAMLTPGEKTPDAGLCVGDEPLEILAHAIGHISLLYRCCWDRLPTQAEIRALLELARDQSMNDLPVEPTPLRPRS
jgi:hypothetical protein